MDSESQQTKENSQIPVPEEIEDKDLGTPTITSGAQQSEGIISAPQAGECGQHEALERYAQHLHSYIREYIAAADRKASFVFTIGAALLVYLYEKNVVVSWLKNPFTWNFSEIIAFSSIVGLSLSCMLAVIVVFPRLSGSRRGFVFWEAISQFSTSTEFVEAAQKLRWIELTQELLRHAHELAQVCKKKYRILNWSLRVGAVGAVSTIIYLLKG